MMSLDLVYVGFSILIAVLGVPLAMGKVPPNPLYGFRTPATQADPDLWYAVNARTGQDLVGGGLLLGAAAWLAPRLAPGISQDAYMGTWTTAVVVVLLLVMLRSGLVLRRLDGDSDKRGDES